MKSELVPLALLTLALSSANAARQPHSDAAPAGGGYLIKLCIEPKEPFGTLPDASGQVTYLLGKDGKADLASVAVVNVTGISVGGFRSVAVRKLSSCVHDMGTPAPKAPVRVVEAINFAGWMVHVVGAAPVATPLQALPVEAADLGAKVATLAFDDPRLEELPRNLNCKGPVIGPFGGTRSDMVAQRDEWMRKNMGQVSVEIQVAANGTADHRVRVISSSNPSANQVLVNLLLSCDFAPGRYRGVAVPSYLRTATGITDKPPG